MNHRRIIFFLFIFFISSNFHNATAQSLNINGDTLLVNIEAEIQLVFPTPPASFSTVPAKTQYRIWNTGTGINLIPKFEDYTPATLLISEAGRSHKFTIVYKRDIDIDEARLYYDYSTEKKLAQHIRETAPYGSSQSVKATANIQADKTDKKSKRKEVVAAEPADSSLTYYELLAQGDKDLKLQNYQDAALSFNKAHALRPDDNFPVQRLEEIKNKLSEKEKSAQAENDKEYLAATTEAKNYLDQKKYTEAQEAYKRALDFKPGDVYVTQELQTINNVITDLNAQKEKQKKAADQAKINQAGKDSSLKQLTNEIKYNAAVKSADGFFKAGLYNSAKIEYNKALVFMDRDWPKDQITKINKLIEDQVAQARAEQLKLKQQQAGIAAETKPAAEPVKSKPQPNTALETKTVEEQSKPKQQPNIVLPAAVAIEQPRPKQKLDIVPVQKAALVDSVVTVADIKKKYAQALAQGRSSYAKDDLANAKVFYEEAMSLNPSQQEPKKQLAIINTKLEALAREAEIENNYERTIEVADSQVNARSFNAAIVSYKAASVIKPLELYPKNQLRYIQSELALIERRKIEDQERRYTNALAKADKAVADKKYEDAKSSYTEVLSIHPENDYAKRRLEIISYQIEKAKAEKPIQDTIIAPPVKKSKRKRS